MDCPESSKREVAVIVATSGQLDPKCNSERVDSGSLYLLGLDVNPSVTPESALRNGCG